MSGQRIDDHSNWIGKGSSESVLPVGCKIKSFSSAEGAGELMRYEDTSEAIKSQQKAGDGKVKAHKMKDGYRN